MAADLKDNTADLSLDGVNAVEVLEANEHHFETEDAPTGIAAKVAISKRLDDQKLRAWIKRMQEKKAVLGISGDDEQS